MKERSHDALDPSEALPDWIRGWLGHELELSPHDIAADETFVRYGMDSVIAMMLVGDLQEDLRLRLPRLDDLSEVEIDRVLAEKQSQALHAAV